MDFESSLNKFDNNGNTHTCWNARPNTLNLLVIKFLMVYILHIFGAIYISYSVPSSFKRYRTLIPSEEVSIYNYNPGMHCTPPGNVYYYLFITNHHNNAFVHRLIWHPQKVPVEKLVHWDMEAICLSVFFNSNLVQKFETMQVMYENWGKSNCRTSIPNWVLFYAPIRYWSIIEWVTAVIKFHFVMWFLWSIE